MGIDPGTNYMGYGVLEIEGRTLRPVVLGDIDLHRMNDPYEKLRYIFERVGALVDEYRPREVALESPFFGENVQSMLKLGRAQGVAIAAAIHHSVPIHEYAPLKIKMAITGPQGAGRGSRQQHAHDRTSAPATGRYGRYGRRPVPPFHEFEPIERRPRRRSVQRTRRRPQGCLGKGQFELGTVFEG